MSIWNQAKGGVSLVVASALVACIVLVSGAREAGAQAITTGTITGTVTAKADGSLLPGVSLRAVHEPTGTAYSSFTREDGTYSIFNVRVGGPYRVTAALDGFRS